MFQHAPATLGKAHKRNGLLAWKLTKVTLNQIASQSANFGSFTCNPVGLVVGNSVEVGELLKHHPAACQWPHPTVVGSR
jgi:hypothetical protein